MIKLTKILAQILAEFYSLQAQEDIMQHSSARLRWLLDRAKPIQLQLRDWFAKLPESLGLDNVKMRKLSSTGQSHRLGEQSD